MQPSVKVLSPAQCKSEYLQHGAMALLLTIALVQIAGAFNASANLVPNDSKRAQVQQQGSTMMAKQ